MNKPTLQHFLISLYKEASFGNLYPEKNFKKSTKRWNNPSRIHKMGLPTKPFCIFSLFLVILTIFKLTSQAKSDSDFTKLIYKGCAKQDLSDPSGVYSQALSSLFGTLVSQSSKSKFYKTSTGSGQTTISGLFQCRGDLSNVQCYKCVSGLPILIDKLCGSKPVAARIQLFGCYMLYEVAGFPQISGMEMLFKTCSGKNVPGSLDRFKI